MQGLRALHRYAEFTGRSGRAEFWQWILISNVAGWVTGILDALQSTPYEPSHKFTGILAIATLTPTIAVGIRRFHDRGKSGWWYGALWISFVLSVGVVLIGQTIAARSGDQSIVTVGGALFCAAAAYMVYCIVQLAKRGDEYDNAYGSPDVAPATPKPQTAPLRQVAAPAAATSGNATTIEAAMTSIERLGKMREQGYLSDAEFDSQKQRVLDEVSASSK